MQQSVIGIDLGGTRIKAVAMNTEGTVLHQVYTPTNDGGGAVWKEAVLQAVNRLQSLLTKKAEVVGISAPGLPDERNAAIAFMPGRLQGLENFQWSSFLGVQTYVLNDAVAALMAEAKWGTARDRKNVAMLTLGTGVGGALLIDGRPYQGAFQKAGHIGHICVNSDGDPDVTGMPGSLEEAIGNTTVAKRSLGRYVDTHALLQGFKEGDHFATWVWLSSVRKLAISLASVTNIFSPDCIVLGGGITEAGADLFGPLESFLSLYEWRAGGNKTQVTKAYFGDMAGAIGAAGFAATQHS